MAQTKNILKIEKDTTAIPPAGYAAQDITEIRFPKTVEEIGEGAFENCTQLRRLWLPRSIKRIGGKAFWGCSGLQRVFIPNTVEEIGLDAFDYRYTEIFCQAPSRPKGWHRDYYEEMGYDEDGQTIVSMYESWCGYDVDIVCPEWAAGSIGTEADPDNLRWGAKVGQVRAVWEQEERVLPMDTRERRKHSIGEIREAQRQYEEGRTNEINGHIQRARQEWEAASASCADGIYPKEFLKAANAYADALEEMRNYYASRHELNKDYMATWEIFRFYCETAPRFEDEAFRGKTVTLKEELERQVYYGAGRGNGADWERKLINQAYEGFLQKAAR